MKRKLGDNLPVDLAVKYGLAQMHLGRAHIPLVFKPFSIKTVLKPIIDVHRSIIDAHRFHKPFDGATCLERRIVADTANPSPVPTPPENIDAPPVLCHLASGASVPGLPEILGGKKIRAIFSWTTKSTLSPP